MLMVGGSTPPRRGRAARLRCGFFPGSANPEILTAYEDEAQKVGFARGLLQPAVRSGLRDGRQGPRRDLGADRAYALFDAQTYSSWQEGTHQNITDVASARTDWEDVRASGVYQVLTPDECVAMVAAAGRARARCSCTRSWVGSAQTSCGSRSSSSSRRCCLALLVAQRNDPSGSARDEPLLRAARLRRLPPQRASEAHRRRQWGAGRDRSRRGAARSGSASLTARRTVRPRIRHGRDLVDRCRRGHGRRPLPRGASPTSPTSCARASGCCTRAWSGHSRVRVHPLRALGTRVARALPRTTDPRSAGVTLESRSTSDRSASRRRRRHARVTRDAGLPPRPRGVHRGGDRGPRRRGGARLAVGDARRRSRPGGRRRPTGPRSAAG